MKKHQSRDEQITAAAFHEVHANEPKIVAHTRATEGAEQAKKQTVAIALSKARAAGAHIPESHQKVVHHSPTMLQVDRKHMKSHNEIGCGGSTHSKSY